MKNVFSSPSPFTRRGINFLYLYSRGEVSSSSLSPNEIISHDELGIGSRCHLCPGGVALWPAIKCGLHSCMPACSLLLDSCVDHSSAYIYVATSRARIRCRHQTSTECRRTRLDTGEAHIYYDHLSKAEQIQLVNATAETRDYSWLRSSLHARARQILEEGDVPVILFFRCSMTSACISLSVLRPVCTPLQQLLAACYIVVARTSDYWVRNRRIWSNERSPEGDRCSCLISGTPREWVTWVLSFFLSLFINLQIPGRHVLVFRCCVLIIWSRRRAAKGVPCPRTVSPILPLSRTAGVVVAGRQICSMSSGRSPCTCTYMYHLPHACSPCAPFRRNHLLTCVATLFWSLRCWILSK
jgi:hypothetical protein